MPVSPAKAAPPPAPYVEDGDDSDDAELPAPLPPVANTAKKVTRRDEASDSGYSSHTFATGSSSQGSKRRGSIERSGLLKVFGMGKKSNNSSKKSSSTEKTKEKPLSPKATRRQSIVRAQKTDDLRATAHGSKEEAPKKRPTVPPIETKIVRAEPAPKNFHPASAHTIRRTSLAAGPPPVISIAQARPRPRVNSMGVQQRPYSFHGAQVMYAPSLPQYYNPGFGAPPPVMMPAASMPQYQVLPQVVYANGPNSPNRVINYNINPTHPPSYFMPNPGQQYWGEHPPMPPRRMSMSAAPPAPPIVEYPRVPQGHALEPWMPRHAQPIMASEYSTPSDSPEEWDGAVFVDDEEAYYRDARRRQDKRAMPPPPLPLQQRPGLGRSATTSAANVNGARRSSRTSIEIPGRSSRKPSIDDGRTTPSRANASKRISQSSYGSGRDVVEPPSPTLRRRSGHISRPTSYQEPPESKHESKIKAAEEYQDAQAGDAKPTALTADVVQRALRDKPEGRRSTRSHSSRTSSKSGDPRKSKHSHSDHDRVREKREVRESRESEPVKVKIGNAVFDSKGRSFNVRQTQDNVEIRVKHESKGREDKTRRSERSTRYLTADPAHRHLAEEIGAGQRPAPRRSQSGRRGGHEHSSSAAVDEEYYDDPRRVDSRNRRRSRSSRRPVDYIPSDAEWVRAGIL